MSTTDTRNHYVFLAACGCTVGVVDADGRTTEDSAWRGQYDTRAEERAAAARGVTVRRVDHETYAREFFPSMLAGCNHADGAQ
jgi:hypothetical protein